MIDQKAVPTLMSLALLPEMQQDCAVALCNLSGCVEKQVVMVEDQIMDAITSLLMEDPNDVVRQRCASLVAVQNPALLHRLRQEIRGYIE